jgi:hypothetical protein
MRSRTARVAIPRNPTPRAGQIGKGETHSAAANTPPPARGKGERPRVSWYASLLIVLMLLLGAGWEFWRWLLLVITLD